MSLNMVKKSKKRAGINGRKKGHDFERKLAKILSKWSGMEMRRTPQSGGWNKTGDITPLRPEDMVKWPLNIEAKCYKKDTYHFEDLLKSADGGAIIKWWKQCLADATISNKQPLLIFTQNYDEIYVLMRGRFGFGQYIYNSRFNVTIVLLKTFLENSTIKFWMNDFDTGGRII